ncbi:MAG TPA: right-handed parallel beta-helix repeat-containing protein [Turneriella sp.]|nr:right-handed parallel beta-helix repeat-containing protein [Turneriella sp.]
MNGLCRIILLLAVALSAACKEYSTTELLNLQWPTGGARSLKITSPSPITVDQPFTVTVTATNTAMPQGIQQDYQNPVDITLQVGNGTIASVNGGGWYLGTQNFTVVYNNPALVSNASEVILLRVTDPKDSMLTTVSNNITATAQAVFNQFKISAPGAVFKGQPFNLTVTAANSDNSTYTAYSGTVNLSTYLVAGTISPSTVTGFVNGVATVSVTLAQSYTNLQIRAVDTVNASITGLSNNFQVYFDSVSLAAFAQSATSIRVTWHFPTGTTQALVYRDSGSGYQLLSTVFLPTTNYTDTTGLTAGQTYPYRVVVQDNLATTQYQATTTAVPRGCATSVSGTVGTTTWTPAQSPYCVTGNISITGTLTVAAGTSVLVNPTFSINVASGGSLVAQGTLTAPIVFTSANASPAPGDWAGLNFASGSIGSTITSDNYSGGSLLQYTIVEFAGPGVTTAESLFFDSCTIQNNRTTTTNGAGISANQAAGRQVVLKNTLVLNNTVATNLYGGGLYATQRAAIYSSKFFNNTITHAANFLRGGAAYLGGDNNLVTSSQFINNSLNSTQSNHQGGALFFNGDFNTITGNTFQGNLVSLINTAHGAAAYLMSNNNTITNNLFTGNTATAVTAGSYGGALVVNGFGNTLTRNTFSGNTSTGTNSYAGAVSLGNNNTLVYNLFTTNAATRGGAIFSNGTTATVNHNQFVSNTGTNGNNLFYGAAGTLNFTNNYWGGATSGLTAMGICDGSNTGGSCATSSGTIDASGAVATPWPLCKTAPSDPDCVGANF